MAGTPDAEAARLARDQEVVRSARIRHVVVAAGVLGSLGLSGIAAITTTLEPAEASSTSDESEVTEPELQQPQELPTTGSDGAPDAQSSGS